MALFTVSGSIDPLLKVKMEKGEEIVAESDAMVSMDAHLSLKGKASGGMMSSLKRAVLQGESLFQQHITAPEKAGEVTLAPTVPGDILILETGTRQIRISDGCFLASESGVSLENRSQGGGKALFGGTGGFFVMETSGSGKVAVSGFGSIHTLDVVTGQEIIVDNGHVVAWESSVEYEVAMATDGSSGFFGKLVNSQTSGEGLVLRFKGQGKVYICSRNRGGFLNWIFAHSPSKK